MATKFIRAVNKYFDNEFPIVVELFMEQLFSGKNWTLYHIIKISDALMKLLVCNSYLSSPDSNHNFPNPASLYCGLVSAQVVISIFVRYFRA